MSVLKSNKTLQITTRDSLGGSSPRRARRLGKIPAVIYGQKEPKFVLVDLAEFSKSFKSISENELISLSNNGQDTFVLIKEYQYDPLAGCVSHIDFFEVSPEKAIRTSVPISLTGTPKGVRDGGVLEVSLRTLRIECLPQDIPSEIKIDISELDKNHSIRVSDVKLSNTSKILTRKEQSIASITFASK